MLIRIVLAGLGAAVAAGPSTKPTTRPAQELDRRFVADNCEWILTLEEHEYRTQETPNGRAARTRFGYHLRVYDRTKGTQKMIWRGEVTSTGDINATDYPHIVAVHVEDDVAVVVYNQRELAWGDAFRFKDDGELEKLVTRVRVLTPETADFGKELASARIYGSVSNESLTVETETTDGKTIFYRLVNALGGRGEWAVPQ